MKNISISGILLFTLIIMSLLAGNLSLSSTPTTTATKISTTVQLNIILHGNGTITLITGNGFVYNINKSKTVNVTADVSVTLLASGFFSVNGGDVTSQYTFIPTNDTTLNITFVQLVNKTDTTQLQIKSIILVILSVVFLIALFYISKKNKEE